MPEGQRLCLIHPHLFTLETFMEHSLQSLPSFPIVENKKGTPDILSLLERLPFFLLHSSVTKDSCAI